MALSRAEIHETRHLHLHLGLLGFPQWLNPTNMEWIAVYPIDDHMEDHFEANKGAKHHSSDLAFSRACACLHSVFT